MSKYDHLGLTVFIIKLKKVEMIQNLIHWIPLSQSISSNADVGSYSYSSSVILKVTVSKIMRIPECKLIRLCTFKSSRHQKHVIFINSCSKTSSDFRHTKHAL